LKGSLIFLSFCDKRNKFQEKRKKLLTNAKNVWYNRKPHEKGGLIFVPKNNFFGSKTFIQRDLN